MPVFGEDDRMDVDQTQDARLRGIAESVPALIPSERVICQGSTCKLAAARYETASIPVEQRGRSGNLELPLAAGTRFYGQPQTASCSGALISPDVVLTAGHCVPDEKACANVQFVFGFLARDRQVNLTVPRGEVYSCVRAFQRLEYPGMADRSGRLPNRDVDFALVKLDRPVPNHAPLRINVRGDLSRGARVLTMGYPLGMPLKIAGNAVVLLVGKTQFYSNIDGFHGNSGGPILNAQTLEIEGVMGTEPLPGDYGVNENGEAAVLRRPDVPGSAYELMGATRMAAVLPYLQP